MSTYPVQNRETGEQKEVVMSVEDWESWCVQNPDWFRFYTPENSPALGLEVGEWKDKLNKKHPGWKEVLKRAEQAPGSRAKNLY